MKRISVTIDEYLKNKDSFDLSEQLVTLDGYIVEDGNYSYDNDYDQTLPNLLQGVKNPNEEDRRRQRPKRNPRFPRKLLSLQKKNIKFWVERQTNLSEIMSDYPHLSATIPLGNRSAKQLIALVLFVNIEMKTPIQYLPLGEDLFEILEKRCKRAGYQGGWSILAKLLQTQRNYIANQGFIEMNFSKRSLYGNYLPMGQAVLDQLVVRLSIFPVRHCQRKRGYSDKGSKKFAHETHDLTTSSASIEFTRDTLDLSSKDALVHFLYGLTNPAKIVQEPVEEIEYRKRLNQQQNALKRQEAKRSKELSSPVRIYYKNVEQE